ncbi:MAG: VIT1/CCC1 transporter family protein [Bacteroidetes bacterium]|nr:VIT1/CCC1 transporter family protein [Bacteroidota bacterium]
MEHDLGPQLVLDELFDLTLYRKVRESASDSLLPMFDEIIPIETKHLAFWQDFFHIDLNRLNFRRRIKLSILNFVARVFGDLGIHLVLEAIEVYGVRKYIAVWKEYKGTPMGEAVRKVLEDEFKHEDEIVTSSTERLIHPERVRDIFLGLNDGLVEILGAVSGFFAALSSASAVLAASIAVAVAGSISMAAGAYGAVNSESEVEGIEAAKREFLGKGAHESGSVKTSALQSGIVVGVSYFVGALVPVVPVLLGASNIFWSSAFAVVAMVFISIVIAFLSGMRMSRRIATNLIILVIAVGVTYSVGLLARFVFGINI